jgi:membrane protein DedA with SNARE-associated domain
MLGSLEQSFLHLVQIIPLHLFVFLGSFLEEVIAPIPSPVVMVTAGTAAALQHYNAFETALLTISGALGKTAGSGFIYIIAYKLEDVISGKLGTFFGISKEKLDAFGSKLTGTWRDYITLLAIRVAPFVPSAIISVGSAVLKVPFTMFLITTFVGVVIRDGLYLYVGYTGTELFSNILLLSNHLEALVTSIAIIVALSIITFFVAKKLKSAT